MIVMYKSGNFQQLLFIKTSLCTGWTIVGYDEVMYAGEKRNLSCSTDLTFTRLEWVNKTDNRVLKTTAVGNRVDLLIPSLSTRHNGNKLACRIVTSCGTDEKSITLNITSKHSVCVRVHVRVRVRVCVCVCDLVVGTLVYNTL